MARLGQSSNNKNTDYGKGYFGDKDQDYLKQLSRQAVEEHHNAPILYLELDWESSNKNFYGEITVKRFVIPSGISIRGAIQLSQNELQRQEGVPYKTMSLVLSIYTEQLQEKGIDPKLGDFFYVGTRFYQIWDKTINDAGPGQLMLNRGRIRCDYKAFEVDDEAIQHQITDQNPGPEWNINHQDSQIIK